MASKNDFNTCTVAGRSVYLHKGTILEEMYLTWMYSFVFPEIVRFWEHVERTMCYSTWGSFDLTFYVLCLPVKCQQWPLLAELPSIDPTVLWSIPVFSHLCPVQCMCIKLLVSRTFTESSLCVSLIARMGLMCACEMLSTPTPAISFPVNLCFQYTAQPLFLSALTRSAKGCGQLQEATNPIDVYSIH